MGAQASGITNLAQSIGGMRTAQAGYEMQAGGYRQAATSTLHAAYYNVQLNNINLNRNLDAMSRQIRGTSSTQRTQAAATGAAVGSKSFLMVQNETLNAFARQASDLRASNKYQNQAEIYAAQTRAAAFENQARMAEWQADQSRRRMFPTIAQGLINLF